jgi:hypothetical protein
MYNGEVASDKREMEKITFGMTLVIHQHGEVASDKREMEKITFGMTLVIHQHKFLSTHQV